MERQFEFNEFGVCTNPETIFDAGAGNTAYIEIKRYLFDNRWEYCFTCIGDNEGFGDNTRNNPYTPDLATVIAKIKKFLNKKTDHNQTNHPCKAQFLAWADSLQKPTLF